jgi:hypothetical protein
LLLAYSPRFQGILQAARKQIEEGDGVRHEDLWREMEGDAESVTPGG